MMFVPASAKLRIILSQFRPRGHLQYRTDLSKSKHKKLLIFTTVLADLEFNSVCHYCIVSAQNLVEPKALVLEPKLTGT